MKSNQRQRDEPSVPNTNTLSIGDLTIKTYTETMTHDIEILINNSACKEEEKLQLHNENNANSCNNNTVRNARPVMQRSKSLKTCMTPPGNTSCPKLVR